MQNPKIIISELGKEDIVRDMTPEEIAELEAATQAAREIREAEAQAAAEAVVKRQALLDKLGITEEEARLLLGGN